MVKTNKIRKQKKYSKKQNRITPKSKITKLSQQNILQSFGKIQFDPKYDYKKQRKKSVQGYKRFSLQSKVIKLREHNPLASFVGISKETLTEVLVASLMDGDPQAFKDVIKAYLETNNKVKIAKKMGVSRKTLYNLFSEEGNPTLNSITKLLKNAA